MYRQNPISSPHSISSLYMSGSVRRLMIAPAVEANRSQPHAIYATSNAARANLPPPDLPSLAIYRGPSASRCALIGTFPKPPTLAHTDQVCPVERPERCRSTSLCHQQRRSTSAHHASSRALLAAQHHIPANTNDMKHGLCTPRRGLAMCAFRSMLRS